MISEFSKVAEYKITFHKSVAFLYTNNVLSEREPKKIIAFTTASMRENTALTRKLSWLEHHSDNTKVVSLIS